MVPVPVTVLTGFSVPGKTTLLNQHFSANQKGVAQCVLVN